MASHIKKIFLIAAAAAAVVFTFSLVPHASAAAAPAIAGVSPSAGRIGDKITIYGSGFSSANIIFFGTGIVSPDYVSGDGTQLTFTVPAAIIPQCILSNPPCSQSAYAPPSGTYVVSVAADSTFAAVSNSSRFDLGSAVAITSIYPSSGPIGTVVTLTGYGFSAFGNAINFGSSGVIVELSNSSSVIKFIVPSGILPRCAVSYPPCSSASSAPPPGAYSITVSPNFDFSQVSSQTSNSVSFQLTSGSVPPPQPVITSVTPQTASVGTLVTIKGTNFSPNFNVADFGNGGVAVLQPSGNDLTFTVPASLFARCAVFGNPTCPQSAPAIPVNSGTYNLSVAIDNSTISGAVPFTISPIPVPSSTPNAPPSNLVSGNRVQASANINVRSSPSISADILETEITGSIGGIAAGPVAADGYNWLQIGWSDGTAGWSADQYLVEIGSSPCQVAAGDRAYVVAGSQTLVLYVRSLPSASAPIVGGELPVVGSTVVSGPVASGSANWWQLKFDDGVTGWAKESDFIDVSCYSYTVPPPPPAQPAISIASPQNGATVSGPVQISASVSATQTVKEVDFFIDNVLVGSASVPPYTWNWDSTKVLNGGHNLYAEAQAGGYIAKSGYVNVNVTGGISPPAVTITSPQSGATVSGQVRVSATVASTLPVAAVYYYIDGAQVGTAAAGPYAFSWDSTQVYNGYHTIGVTATTGVAGIPAGTQTISVNVTGGKTPPSAPQPILVFFNAPQAGATISGSVQLNVSVSSTAPVSSVDFYADGIYLGTANSVPYAAVWDAAQVLNGAHSLSAAAKTSQGSGSQTIIVNVAGGLTVPTVTFNSPQNGATVSGSVPISVSVNANNPAATEVDLYADGVLLGALKAPPYSVNWDSSQVYNGTHALSATARTSNASISGGNAIAVNVTGGIPVPSSAISLSSPQGGATVWGTVQIAASVSSNIAVTGVDFYVDSAFVGTSGASPYSVSWDTTKGLLGSHTIFAVARSSGASATSQPITANVVPPPIFALGGRVTVQTGTNFGLNVRSGPSLNYPIIGNEPNGSTGTIVGGPAYADSFFWWRVNWDNGTSGWSVESYFK